MNRLEHNNQKKRFISLKNSLQDILLDVSSVLRLAHCEFIVNCLRVFHEN